MNLDSFHFLRPGWLLALAALVILFWIAHRDRRSTGAWERVCDAPLLRQLRVDSGIPGSRAPLALFALGWITACIALAGPTWERLPQPAFQAPTQTAVVLNLSDSMRARDVKPSRVERARYELADLLDRVDGAAGLVIYAEEPYAVTPLTDDPDVIAELLPILNPDLMPGRGSRLDRAIDEARTLLSRAGAQAGRIVVIGDGLGDRPNAALEAAGRVSGDGHHVAVLGIGGDTAGLERLARAGGGPFAQLAADDADVEQLLSRRLEHFGKLEETDVRTDVWRDIGGWLVFVPLLLAPFAFRRGWAAGLVLLGSLAFGSAPASASGFAAPGFADWWSRPDQQGARAFEEGKYAEAATLFEDAAWRATAQYRAGDYTGAAETLGNLDSSRTQYNLGNALARAGELEQALARYDELLEVDPAHEDARHNRELLEKLLEQQQPQQEQKQASTSSQSDETSEAASNASGEQEDSSSDDGAAKGSREDSAAEHPSDASEQAENAESSSDQNPGADAASDSAGNPQDGAAPDPEASASPKPGAQDERPAGGSEDADAAGTQPEPDAQASEDAAAANAVSSPEAEPAQEPAEQRARAGSAHAELNEEDQEAEQWLNRVPDDPGGLLREKLRRRYAEQRFRAALGGTR